MAFQQMDICSSGPTFGFTVPQNQSLTPQFGSFLTPSVQQPQTQVFWSTPPQPQVQFPVVSQTQVFQPSWVTQVPVQQPVFGVTQQQQPVFCQPSTHVFGASPSTFNVPFQQYQPVIQQQTFGPGIPFQPVFANHHVPSYASQPQLVSVLPVTSSNIIHQMGQGDHRGVVNCGLNASLLPSAYLTHSLSQGRGPSILTADAKFRSPFFEWGKNSAGDIAAVGLNAELLPLLTKSPGEGVIDLARNKAIKNELELLRTEIRHLPTILKNSNYLQARSAPQPVGFFDQPSKPKPHEDWFSNRVSTPYRNTNTNDGIYSLSRVNSTQINRLGMRSLARDRHGLPVDTIFDKAVTPRTCDSNDIISICKPRILSSFSSTHQLPARSPPAELRRRIPGELCQVKLTKHKYYCIPDVTTLDTMMRNLESQCIVDGFTVGHPDFGKIFFPGRMNVKGLNLDLIVNFEHKKVQLYANSPKPPYGSELNRRAFVTLFNVWPKCPTTGETIRDLNKLTEMRYSDVLKRTCSSFDGRFTSYNHRQGTWEFEIQIAPDDPY